MKKANFQFIHTEKSNHSIAMLCRVMGVTRQGYHAWVSRKPCMHERRDCELAGLICDIYHENRRVYGSPKIFMMLKRTGVKTSRKRVSRLMKEYGLRGVSRGGKRKTTNKPVFQRPSAEDLVNREFSAKEANQAWFADITYVKTHQGWLYLAAVMDIWSRKIVGWSMASSMTAKLVDDALHVAIARRNPPEGCLHHSDHGSQYRSLLVGKTMKSAGIVPSMGAISSPWDNAVCESLMGTIKAECVHLKTYKTKDEAACDIFEYIETFYNKRRIHSALGWLSPDEFEAKMLQCRKSA